MKLNVVAPPLAGLQGTAFMVKAHTVVLGLAGLAIAVALLRRRGVGSWGQLFAAATLGACTLWGPYATVLFSHVTAGVAVGAMILAAESMTDTSSPRHRIALGLAAGLAGAWAVATEYALLPVVVLLPLLLIRLRDWPWIALGAAPMVAMTLAYHYAAFGSPWSIGYDFHTNFEFARERTTTFRGDPLEGAWMLWGLGRGAGVLALSPIVLVGIVGLLQTGPTRRWLLALTPFFGLLAFHQTPWGGASNDHRYLVPALPLVAVGLGLLWDRLAPGGDRRALLWRVILLTLAAASGWLGWLHFLAGRDS
jgi:hypothetical protein